VPNWCHTRMKTAVLGGPRKVRVLDGPPLLPGASETPGAPDLLLVPNECGNVSATGFTGLVLPPRVFGLDVFWTVSLADLAATYVIGTP
jgi:hypothetical protein